MVGAGPGLDHCGDPASVLASVRCDLRGGGTVLLHDSDLTAAQGCWRSTLGTLPDLVRGCRAAGWTDAMTHRRHIRLTVACLLEIVAGLAVRLSPPAVGLAAIAVLLVLVLPLCWPRRRGRAGRPER